MKTVRFSSCCLAAMGMASAAAAWRLGLWHGGAPGPGLFPLLAALMLLGTSIGAAMQCPEDLGGAEPADRTRLLKHALAMAAFAIAFGFLGVVPATFGFVVGVLRGIERLRWSQALAIAAVLAAMSWIVFRQLLGVPLPAGLLEVG